jgi:hypothetical protein
MVVSCCFLLLSAALGQGPVVTITSLEPSTVQLSESTRIVLQGTNLDQVTRVDAFPSRIKMKCDAANPCPVLEIQSQTATTLALLVTAAPKTPPGDYLLAPSAKPGATLDATAQSQMLTVSRTAVCFSYSPLADNSGESLIKGDEVYCSASIVGWREARNAFGTKMANDYLFVEVTVTNLATDKDLFIVGMNINFGDRFNTDPRDSEVLAESAKRAQTYASRSWIFRGLLFANGLVGGVASTDFAPDELQIANGQLSAFIPGLDKLWPDHTARELELFIEKTFVRSTAIVRRNNDTHTFEVAIEQKLFLTKEERKQLRKYKTVCPKDNPSCQEPAPLIVNLQNELKIALVDTGIVGVNEPPRAGQPVAAPPRPAATPGSGPAATPRTTKARAVPLLSPR